jgi:starch-binding outer membrane protein, SusD/RagB family
MVMNCKNRYFILLIISISLCAGCKKFVQIPPPLTEVTSSTVFADDATAISAMNGIYSQMMGINAGFANGYYSSITLLNGLSADELLNFSTNPDQQSFYTNSLESSNGINFSFIWEPAYQYIYDANAVLEGLTNNTKITSATSRELQGEAKFIRSFCYFYLVNLYGDVPLITSTNFEANAIASRSPAQNVYQQIIADLQNAQTLLVSDYSFSSGERVRPNKWGAASLLARVFLYNGDWKDAETEADSVITYAGIYNLVNNLDSVFLANSAEAIWQLEPILPGFNTYEGNMFILSSPSTNAALSPSLLSSFEPGDLRETDWVNNFVSGTDTFYFPYKYKIQLTGQPLTEYSMVLRLAEQYLIRAEARAMQNNISGSQSDLNIIRSRAGLPNTPAATQQELINALLHERRVEFFTEWGHRWLDLKRTSHTSLVLGSEKPSWQSLDTLYPIPQAERTADPNLTQNPGY